METLGRAEAPACSEQRPRASRISPAALLVKVTARIAAGGHAVGGDEMRDAVRDHAGFAAAGAGQNQQRPFDVGNSFALLGVETLKKIHEEKRGISFSLACGPLSNPATGPL